MFYKFRKLSFWMFLLSATSFAFGDTAFDAIQVIKNEKGPAVASAVCEIHGERGGPAPEKWIFLLNDPKSRSGLREIVVSRKKIVSDRTPLAEYGGIGTMPVLNTDTLTLDSDGAFQIINKHAVAAGVGFHWIDYKLTRGETGAVWKIHLTDYMGGPVGNIYISAENGTVVRPLKLDPDLRSSSKPRSEWVEGGGLIGHANQTATNVLNSTKKTVDKTVKFTEKTATKTKNTMMNAGEDVQEWLTGKRPTDSNKDGD